MAETNKKIAVVTGATGGLGSEISLRLLKNGVHVILLGREFKNLRKKLKKEKEKGNNEGVTFMPCDFENEIELEEVVHQLKKVQKINYLIHCAAFYNSGRFRFSTIENLDRAFQVNYRAPCLLTRELIPNLEKAKGVIIFINSSVINKIPSEMVTHYRSTKMALKSLADCVRADVNRNGVRVLSVILGKIATNMQKKACAQENIPYVPEKMIQPEEAAGIILEAADAPASTEVTDIFIRPSVSYNRGK